MTAYLRILNTGDTTQAHLLSLNVPARRLAGKSLMRAGFFNDGEHWDKLVMEPP